MAQLTLLLVLAAATVVLAAVAKRIRLPYPVLLLIFGLLIAFFPGRPSPAIRPDLILPLVLPPLLFAAARRTSWREFHENRRAISLLAVALVGVTALAVGFAVQALVPGLPLVAAITLGVLVAPPDAVAATAVARELRLPRRLQTILEGEGLFNDATALVLYEVAVAGAVTGTFSPWRAGSVLALNVVVGVLIGLVVAVVTRWLLNKLPPHPGGSALVLVMPFAAYVAAVEAHGSGVLAVVTLALALSRHAGRESAQTRLVTGTAWEIIELIVTGVAFAFVGLKLRAVARDVPSDLSVLIGQALLITAVVIAVRFLWIFLVTALDKKTRFRRGRTAEPAGWREMTVASWAGMRGVVTLAAALALPIGFPDGNRVIFIAFVVVVVTLLLQGLTLPLLVRRLGVRASTEEQRDAERELIRRASHAGLQRLEEIRAQGQVDGRLIDQAQNNAEKIWQALGFDPRAECEEDQAAQAENALRIDRLEAEVLAAARQEVASARNEPGWDPTVADSILRRLDARGIPTG